MSFPGTEGARHIPLGEETDVRGMHERSGSPGDDGSGMVTTPVVSADLMMAGEVLCPRDHRDGACAVRVRVLWLVLP